jgi:branched-chain amino acid aminotransferase
VIATDPYLGVGVANKVKLYVITCPVGPYYPTGFKPIKLLADDKNVRAWPGGCGASKVDPCLLLRIITCFVGLLTFGSSI